MPLFVDGTAVETIDTCLSDGSAQLKEQSGRFLNSPTTAVTGEQLLYVCQGEYGALLPSTPGLRYIGSEDATTCHIVILRHTGSRAVCLGHLDGTGTAHAVISMLSLIRDLSTEQSGRVELHICGGFIDPGATSRKLSREILNAFQKSSDAVHLVTACMSESNDTIKGGIHFPVIYGVGVDVSTGRVFKATFTQKQPDIVLRSARFLSHRQQMVKVFDNETNSVVIEPFVYLPLPAEVASLSDAEILEGFSTSPEQEPPGFAEHMRSVIRFTLDNIDPALTVFPGGQARTYKMNLGQWVQATGSLPAS